MFLTAGTVNGNGKVMILMMISMNLLAFLWKLVEEPLNKMEPGQVIKKAYNFILACSWLRQYVSNSRVPTIVMTLTILP